ncbi:MAG: hypothetical protein CME69_12540 [Halobacteriovorax sp.]|nr:hypothetical protein [Halobacteriovorax sp.]|tara:strand:- start:440 stop:1360 length:921 start_codon:yes stop_codon:yes gene_type:complete
MQIGFRGLFVLILLSNAIVLADYDPCKFIDYKFCGNKNSTNKSLGASEPSLKRNFNSPSSVALVRGLGLESIVFDKFDFSIVFGTSRVGAGASGTNTEDTFFGNTAKEYFSDYESRRINQVSYDLDKYSFALGKTLLSTKGNMFKFNVGLLTKYVKPTGDVFVGPGASVVLGALNAGYATYKDQGNSQYTRDDFVEYNVETYSFGLNIPFFSFDYTVFENDTEEINRVEIYSLGVFVDRWMISYGRRMEESTRRKYDFDREVFTNDLKQWSTFIGVQYFYSKKVTVGLLSNYYLNQELSMILTIFP